MDLTTTALIGLPIAQANVEQTGTPATAVGITTQPGGQRPPTSQPAPWWASNMIPLAMILLLAWLLIFRPKNKQEKQRVEMLNTLKKGDRIQTIGGIIGTVAEVRDDEVVVKVDEASNTKLTFSRNAIHRVREEQKK